MAMTVLLGIAASFARSAGIHESLQKRRLPTRDARAAFFPRRGGKSAFTFRIVCRPNAFRHEDDGIGNPPASRRAGNFWKLQSRSKAKSVKDL